MKESPTKVPRGSQGVEFCQEFKKNFDCLSSPTGTVEFLVTLGRVRGVA